jgi:hypothetical protein
MPRSLWKGSISFGLVNIPIELHTAVRDHRPKFRMLHAADKSPVKCGGASAMAVRRRGRIWSRDTNMPGGGSSCHEGRFQGRAVEKTHDPQHLTISWRPTLSTIVFRDAILGSWGRRGAYALLREAIRDKGA